MLVTDQEARGGCGARKEKIIQKERIKYKEGGDKTMEKDGAECA